MILKYQRDSLNFDRRNYIRVEMSIFLNNGKKYERVYPILEN